MRAINSYTQFGGTKMGEKVGFRSTDLRKLINHDDYIEIHLK